MEEVREQPGAGPGGRLPATPRPPLPAPPLPGAGRSHGGFQAGGGASTAGGRRRGSAPAPRRGATGLPNPPFAARISRELLAHSPAKSARRHGEGPTAVWGGGKMAAFTKTGSDRQAQRRRACAPG